MFPTQSKVNRSSRLWLLPVVALAMLLVGYVIFAASKAQAQEAGGGTVAGDLCIEGIVIDWEEKPLAGWAVTLTSDISGFATITEISAPKPEEDDPEFKSKKSKQYPFEYPEEDPDLEKGEFEFSETDLDEAIDDFPSAGAQFGTYTATIETREGWEGVTPTTLTFDLEAGEDDCLKIRFKMLRIVVVEVYKIDADHQPLGDWDILAVPGPGNLFASPQEEETSDPFTVTVDTVTVTVPMTDPITGMSPTVIVTTTSVVTGGQAVFTLTPGLWIFTEQAPKQDRDEAPNVYQPIVPPNGRQELLIDDDLDPSEEPLRIVFKNELVTGCFIVRKVGLTGEDVSVLGPSYNVAGWGFKLLRKDDSVARQGVTDATGELRFDNLPLGPYTIVEEDRAGWDEVTAREIEINVTGNECEGDTVTVITFENQQDDSGFCVEGEKIDANGGFGLPDWEITIEPLDEGGYDPDNVFTDDMGEFTIEFPRNDYRIPGAQYEICELEQDGWLPHSPTCQTVRLPEWPGACIELAPFINQQVGHSESQDHGKPDHGKGDNGYDKGGPDNGYHDGPSNGSDNKCVTYHEVKAGEGLYDIGAQYQISPQAMLDANPDVRKGNELWVYVGQRICIP